MTEIIPLELPPDEPPPCRGGHGQLVDHRTYVVRRYTCGHHVVERGHLDTTSHRMVWDAALQELPEDQTLRNALALLVELLDQELRSLTDPPW